MINIIFYFILCTNQVQQTNKDDEDIAKAIAAKLKDTPGISYTEIASKALDCGRTQLAIRVCNMSTYIVYMIIMIYRRI